MRVYLSLAGAAVILLASSAARAEDIDCANPTTQSDMTSCEAARHDAADKALNAQYKKTRAAMVAIDGDLDADMKGAEKALVKAQRAWIDYRDAECDAAGFQARGGTMEPTLVAGCLADITDKRTKELKELEDSMSN
ncbi:lysozyme inhibitor LprI family protein [Rhizobium binxianense]|uniref:lysozyme inhibitor LprI family protein n=1 Tax=Rhizobium binxianense TaxID=3024242 RepID=UPI00235ECC2A|nr:lysozyme inhibitor LprI family protein [Rhizobium sp. MJ37]MDC9836222.1 lysozyme inhibitor LprI family protein [Rhizobium sp. MJ37]